LKGRAKVTPPLRGSTQTNSLRYCGIQAFQHFLESRVVAERVHERVNLQAMQNPIAVLKCFFKLGAKCAIDTGDPTKHHILRFSYFSEFPDDILCFVSATGFGVGVSGNLKHKLIVRVSL